MPIPRALIPALAQEVAEALTGGWIQKITQPVPQAVLLEIRTPGRTLRLLLAMDPDHPRLHLVDDRPPNPPTPPAFCQYLRAHVQGARIDAIEQIHGDRIIRMALTAREGPCALLAELIPGKADLKFVDGENTVLRALRSRSNAVGQRYQPPSLTDAPTDAGGMLAELDPAHPYPLSAWLARRVDQQESRQAQTRSAQRRRSELARRMKKVSRRLDALKADLDKTTRFRDYARYGDLLKAQLSAIAKGADRAVVTDYFDPTLPELVLPLDPAKTPHGNLEEYFKKHRKYVTAQTELPPRIAAAEAELAGLRAEREALDTDPASVHAVPGTTPHADQTPSGTGQRRHREQPERRGPFRRFTSTDGHAIYVGRNARENEALTFSEARPEDVWLHARGVPGSHVVVRVQKGTDVPPDTLMDAATLALLYSDLKKSGRGDVIYTKRKYVRKAKGAAPGTVTVTQEKAIFVTLDRRRLEALKTRQATIGP